MGKKAHFVKSKHEPFEHATCDKCGLLIADVQEGIGYWNPNPRAHDRNICHNCYDVWYQAKLEKYKLWKDKHEEMMAQQGQVTA